MAPWLELRNALAKISADPATGELRELVNLAAGEDYLRRPGLLPGAPLRLACLDEGGRRLTLSPGRVVSAGLSPTPDGTQLTVEHASCQVERAEELPMRCVWRVALPAAGAIPGPAGSQGTLSTWTLTVENGTSGLRVVEVLFPYLRGLQVGSDPQNEVLLYPHHAGERIENPVAKLVTPRYQQFGRANTEVAPEGYYFREINYCGLASMTWLDFHDPRGGLYLASYDPGFPLTGLRHETGGPAEPWTGFAFRRHLPVRPGQTWTSAPYALGLHTGDWHWGARQYRRWISPYLRLPGVPEDLRRQAALCPRYDFRKEQRIHHRFREIPEMFARAKGEGIAHFFIAGWNRQGFDTNYPEYLPDMELGSSWELAEGVRYVREHGGFVTFYVNARLFDTGSDYWEPLGRKWALKGPQGELSTEVYDPPTVFAALCPGHPDWQRWVTDTAGWMVRAFGARGIYLDQLGSATPLPCYDESHGHRDPATGGRHHGLFNQGYLKLLQGVRARLQALDPASFLMIENCGDIYSQYLYANLTWNGEPYDEFFNLYKYTFPEFLQVNMVNPRRIPDKALRTAWFQRDLARAFVLGSIFWVELGERFGPEDADLLDLARRALRLREAAAPYLARATYLDDLGLALPSSSRAPDLPWCDLTSITASRWALPGGAWLLLFSNPEERPGLTLGLAGLEGEELAVEGAGETLQPGRRFRRQTCALGGTWSEGEAVAERDGHLRLDLPDSRLSLTVLTPLSKRRSHR